jgi:hypothetical protein
MSNSGAKRLIKSYLGNRYQRVKFNYKLSKWAKINTGVPQGSVLGLVFFKSINNLLSVIPYTSSNKNSSILLFADYTSVVISEPCLMNFETKLNIVLQIMKEWFNSNFILLNFDKTYYMQFITKNKSLSKINIEHENKTILKTNFVKFLGMTVDYTLSWKQHIDTSTPKLNKACYTIRRSKLYLSNDALKWYTMPFFHSVTSYDLTFWGNTTHSKCVFKLQKRAIRIIMRARNYVESFFRLLKILPLPAQYIYSLLML